MAIKQSKGNAVKTRSWIKWYFLPHDSIPRYALRVGILWFSPIMFVSMRIGVETSRSLTESAFIALTAGAVYGVVGHPYLRWAMKIQKRVDTYRQSNVPWNRFARRYVIEIAPIAIAAIIMISLTTMAALTAPDWLPMLTKEAV